MKKLFSLFVLLMMALSLGTTMTSCSKNEDNPTEYLAVVTVVPGTGQAGMALRVDENTVLHPTNITHSPFDKEVRAFVRYYKNGTQTSAGMTDVNVTWMDDMLTKDLAENKGAENATAYGSDPVELFNDWCTVAEDGYMTLHFSTIFGQGATHYINMVNVSDADHPLKFRLYHDAKGDKIGRERDSFVAFKMFDRAAYDKDVTIELEWDSFSGVKTAQFKHNAPKPVASTSEVTVNHDWK